MVAEHRVNRHRLLLTGNDQASRSVAMQISSSVIDANLAINDLSSFCILVVCRTPIILLRRSGWINKTSNILLCRLHIVDWHYSGPQLDEMRRPVHFPG